MKNLTLLTFLLLILTFHSCEKIETMERVEFIFLGNKENGGCGIAVYNLDTKKQFSIINTSDIPSNYYNGRFAVKLKYLNSIIECTARDARLEPEPGGTYPDIEIQEVEILEYVELE